MRCGGLRRRPSTRMSSCAGSALVPMMRTVSPFTITRPLAISFSAARREATPALARIFWRRSCMVLAQAEARALRTFCSLRSTYFLPGDSHLPSMSPQNATIFQPSVAAAVRSSSAWVMMGLSSTRTCAPFERK